MRTLAGCFSSWGVRRSIEVERDGGATPKPRRQHRGAVLPSVGALLALLLPSAAFSYVETVSLSASPSSIAEGAEAAYTLAINGLHDGATLVVEFSGTADPGTDFTITALDGADSDATVSGNLVTVVFDPGNGQSGTGTIVAIADGVTGESSETVTATVVSCSSLDPDPDLVDPAACPIGATATVTITDADSLPSPAPDGGDEGTVSMSTLPGLTGPQRSMASTTETVCRNLSSISAQRTLNSAEQDLFTQCSVLIANTTSNPTAVVQGIAALTPEQASAPRKLSTQVTGAQLDNVGARLTALRRGARGISLGNLTVNAGGQSISGNALAAQLPQSGETGGAASADESYQFERLGVFVNGNIDWGGKDRSANEDGFNFQTLGVTAGVDYRFLEGLVLGVALGYGSTDVDIDANGGDLDVSAWTGMLYGTYYATDHFYVEGSATYGWGDFEQTRNIDYSLLGGARKAKADYDGTNYAFMLGAGYDFIRGEGILDVYGRVRYVQADLDGYRESGASGLDLDIGSQEATSVQSILGVNYTHSISTAKAVLVPQGWFEWAHEFEGGDDQVTGVYANDPSRISFALATDKFDSDYFRVGVGLGAQFGQGRTAFVSYEAAIGLRSYTEHTASIGMRLDF